MSRIARHPILGSPERGKLVTFSYDGRELEGYEGEPIAMKYVPRLADAKIVRTWSGWEDESADGVPVISSVDEVPGLTIACAFTGHVRDNKEFYAAYLGRNKGEPVFARMAEYRLSGNERLTHPQQSISPTQLEYRLRFFGAGYDAMIKLWIERGCKESPEELRSVFEPFMLRNR